MDFLIKHFTAFCVFLIVLIVIIAGWLNYGIYKSSQNDQNREFVIFSQQKIINGNKVTQEDCVGYDRLEYDLAQVLEGYFEINNLNKSDQKQLAIQQSKIGCKNGYDIYKNGTLKKQN